MIENTNPSYETLIKRLQQIYQQTQSNKESIQNSQPDNSKIYLDQNWLQNIGIIDDTRVNGQDVPIHPITYTTLVQDIIPFQFTEIPINFNITTDLMPMTISYNYQKLLPNVTKEIIPFLEYQTSFSVPTGNMSLSAGFLWKVDSWINLFVITANSDDIWRGYDPPFGTNIEISQYQVDNNYATFFLQSYKLSFTSTEGGIYGGGALVNVNLLSIFDETASIFIPVTSNAISNFLPGHVYQFNIWSEADQESFTIEYSLLTTATIAEQSGAYIAYWSSGIEQTIPFYIFQNPISGGIVEYELFPPAINEMTNPLNPIIFTINPDGPVKYSDIIGQNLLKYIPASPSYDTFYIRQSKSTDTIEKWISNINFGALVTTQGVKTTGAELPQYNDTYTWTLVDSDYEWVPVYNHNTILGDQYLPIESDMNVRVRVVVRPIINWKKTDKYQL